MKKYINTKNENEGKSKELTNTKQSLILHETIDMNSPIYKRIQFIYSSALKVLTNKIEIVKEEYNMFYDYNLIDHINIRIKSNESIIKKMQKKKINLSYGEMIENINDIAGIRVICPMKDDIYTIRDLISKFPDIQILEEKDYINNPKESGYMSYHMILNIPVTFAKDILYVKVELQIRTITMDYWSQIEHKKRYKSNKELSQKEKNNFMECAKLITILDNKMMSLNPIKIT